MVSMQQKASPFSQNTCVQLHNKTFEPCVVGRGCDNLTLKLFQQIIFGGRLDLLLRSILDILDHRLDSYLDISILLHDHNDAENSSDR